MSLPDTVHGSAVRLGPHGILIRGASGSGKSTLVLHLLAGDAAAQLIADDRVILSVAGGRLLASAPEPLAGLLEVRGQGLIRRPFVSPASIDLVVDLRPPAECPRLPAPEEERTVILGLALPRLILPAGLADGALRVRIAVERWLVPGS
jgi:serine kinase of HPr protein (carbohydrate metabolism regulator)